MTDTNCKSLIVHNLDPRITEDSLKAIFALISPTLSVKIIDDDKNVRLYFIKKWVGVGFGLVIFLTLELFLCDNVREILPV